MRRFAITLSIFVVLLAPCCKEPFDAKLAPSQSNYLVVEGIINGRGSTTINLSRTVALKDVTQIKPELNAQVTIVGQDNSVYNVKGTSKGTYISDSVSLNFNLKYRLHIKTATGGEYLSEYVPVRQTPGIDSVNWKLQNNGVQIYTNTHDPQNNTRYYKWDYEETWEINSAFENYVKYINGRIIQRDLSEMPKLFYCWKTQKSTGLLLSSSVQLTNDVINLAPTTFIPLESERFGVRYSILVKQYALDKKSYDFYQLMKSNTETLGSVFDPLPSELTGNISCVSNASEKVIGYVSASTIEQKRIFIARQEVPSKFQTGCGTTYVTPDSVKFYFESGLLLPYQVDGSFPGPVAGYYSSAPTCIDCTLRGGSSTKPSFW